MMDTYNYWDAIRSRYVLTSVEYEPPGASIWGSIRRGYERPVLAEHDRSYGRKSKSDHWPAP